MTNLEVICVNEQRQDIEQLIAFRLEANVNTYAAYMNETKSTRLDSHDFTYSNGAYTYVGGEQFAGEEAIWYEGKSQYAMNYVGRALGQLFSGDFLKEALRKVDMNMPYRGPEYYQSGEYIYVKLLGILHGFKDIKKFIVIIKRYMNAIFMEA